MTHPRVLRTLRSLHRLGGRRHLRVLVPGAGTCRLAWEIARLGHRVEASDLATEAIIAAHSILDGTSSFQQAQQPLPVYVHARCEAGVLRRDACLRPTMIPSLPRVQGRPSTLTLSVADFMAADGDAYLDVQEGRTDAQEAGGGNSTAEGITPGGAWDVVVTSYFIDTLADPLAAVRLIHNLLKPGGTWINFGPLQWHQQSTGVLRLTLDELLRYAGRRNCPSPPRAPPPAALAASSIACSPYLSLRRLIHLLSSTAGRAASSFSHRKSSGTYLIWGPRQRATVS